MNPYELLSPDLIRLAFLVGMIISVLLYERSHLTTGSIVVPGFLGVHIFEPLFILISILNAWICFLLVHRIFPKFCLLENKTKFHALIVTSVCLQLSWNALSSLNLPLAIAGQQMSGLGFVIPGLIAHDMNRNGVIKTGLNTIFVSFAVGAMVLGCLTYLPDSSLNPHTTFSIAFSIDLALVLVLGTVGSVLLKVKTPIRSGGYVTAAYLVFFGVEWIALATILLAAFASYAICSTLIIPNMIIFGRRKFASMLIIGAIVFWINTVLLSSMGIRVPLVNHPAYAGIIILLPGLIANDMHRVGITRVLTGMGLLVSWIFVIANLYYEVRFYSRPEYVFPLVGCLSGIWLVIGFLSNPRTTPYASTPPVAKVA